jgi:hypothetical protein
MRALVSTILTISLAAATAPALATNNRVAEISVADGEVTHQAQLMREALQGGDAATIAVARAKLQAARAAAWGKRHPARAPVERLAIN